MSELKRLQRRLLEISFKHGLSHIGSCYTALPIIYDIYKKKSSVDIFALGIGHAFLAQAIILEEFEGQDAEELLEFHGIHPNRAINHGIYVTSGSLGLSESVALGLALAEKERDVYLLSSDGGFAEGVVFETLRIKADNKINNLKWYVNANGFGAYCEIDYKTLKKRIHSFDKKVKVIKTKCELPGLSGLEAHYKILNEDEYLKLMKLHA